MSSNRLREAAALLREHAGAAMPGPWWTSGITVRGGPEGRAVAPAHNADRANAIYIAAMHPGVGDALADWLGAAARDEDARAEGDRYPLAIADLILGGAS